MKNLTKLFAITVVLLGVYSSSFAVDPTATGKATATVSGGGSGVTVTLAKVNDLAFGSITPGSIDGVITQTAANAAATPVGTGLSVSGGTAASFTLTSGSGTFPVAITNWPTFVSCTTIGHTDQTMALSDTPLSNIPETGIITTGTFTIYVGSTLNVSATQYAGDYASTDFTVTVDMP